MLPWRKFINLSKKEKASIFSTLEHFILDLNAPVQSSNSTPLNDYASCLAGHQPTKGRFERSAYPRPGAIAILAVKPSCLDVEAINPTLVLTAQLANLAQSQLQ